MGTSQIIWMTKMESESTAKEVDKPAAKKFSPFSVDSLLATKIVQQAPELPDNNNEIKTDSDGVDLTIKVPMKEEIDDFDDDCDTYEDDEEEEDLGAIKHPEQSTSVSHVFHPRFPLGMPLGALPPVTSGWANPINPWMTQFRSPLNPFLPSKSDSL
jgi:hypothetical protein